METAKAPATSTDLPANVLSLGPGKDLSETCTVSFEPKAPPCSQTYETVIYATEEQEFWLLPRRAAESMNEAIYILEKQIAPSKSQDERLKGLDDSGLLEYFLEPKLSNFLEGTNKARMQEIEAEVPDIALGTPAVLTAKYAKAEAEKEALPKATAEAKTGKELSIERMKQYSQEQDLREDQRNQTISMNAIYNEWKALKDIAVAKARTEGYTYENGSLFTPQAMEARKRVQTYLEKRKPLLKSGKTYSADEIASLLAEDKKRYEDLRNCMSTCNAAMSNYGAWKAEQAGKFNYAAYTDAIIKVAEYGIAVPEYALIDGDLASGIQQFNSYLATEKSQLEVNERLRAKYKSWIEASGQNAQAPAGLVAAERAEWERLQAIKQALKEKAEQNIAAAPVRRHLLWDPEQFQPQPADRLVKAGFPLREVSTLGAKKKTLSWLSILNLRDAKSIIASDLKKAGKKVPEAFKTLPTNGDGGASKDAALSVFGQWLTSHGAMRIDDQAGDWFDHDGWFDIEKFHTFLQSKGCKVVKLQSASDRLEWGERLKQVVFKESIRSDVRLFDKSPQAQFVRCLTPPQDSIHHEFKGKGPSFSVSDGLAMSGNVALSIDLARGEVELLKVDLPDRNKAKDVSITYYVGDARTPKTMSLGRFSMHFGARAWGYAGASLMLAGSIGIGRDNVKYGVNLDPIKPAQREDDAAKQERSAYEAEEKSKKEAGPTLPSDPLKHESKAATAVSNNTSETKLKGYAANVQIDQGAKASFNLFAGMQAGIELTGAMNWAPPKDLAALKAAPTLGISNSAEAKSESPWLTLAKLSGSIGGAFGAGIKADAQVSVDKGKFILNMKAAVVLGPGATGSFAFEVGYEAVVDLINLFRRELHKNEGQRVTWMSEEAADLASRLNLLGAVGLDVDMMYLMGVDAVMSLYEALTSGGRGGAIAHTIMTYNKPAELEEWFVNATPAALGPMFMTLTSEPKAFEVSEPRDGIDATIAPKITSYSKAEAYLLQQQSIELIIRWIMNNARRTGGLPEAQRQFEDACKRMNTFGTLPEGSGQAYCQSRYKMDSFMKEAVLRLNSINNDSMRREYFKNSKVLGGNLDTHCSTIKSYDTFYRGTLTTYKE
ncbi:peptidoglycan-binding protein LysM [Pseudomonas baltica]|uniref:peptidoglycan-binding protein LysM n=1 Tax=Pseudomonas baltica TaxID=2762576 RepID=UPI00289690AF|nr:peptidoglycan-binding protein LysM [Pseudomonas baltica]